MRGGNARVCGVRHGLALPARQPLRGERVRHGMQRGTRVRDGADVLRRSVRGHREQHRELRRLRNGVRDDERDRRVR